MFSKPGRAKNRTNPSKIEKRAKIQHRSVMLSALQLFQLFELFKAGINTKKYNVISSGYWMINAYACSLLVIFLTQNEVFESKKLMREKNLFQFENEQL